MKLTFKIPHTTHTSSHTKVKERMYRKSDPFKTWHLLLSIAALLLFISLAFHTRLYMQVNKGMPIDTTGSAGTEKINERKLTYILSYFEERAQQFELEKLTTPAVSDPSL